MHKMKDFEFEDAVRHVARLLWPRAEFDGAMMIEGRERDGIFHTEDYIYAIECTTSRRKDKAIEDCTRLAKVIRQLGAKHPDKSVKGWFITLDEPTADQRSVIASNSPKIVACSFDQFRAKLVDARSYISLRKRYAFGSVRDPRTNKQDFDFRYVALDILDDEGRQHTVSDIVSNIDGGRQTVVLTGDYGAGKSSTCKEVFSGLAGEFLSNQTTRFPVMLNLRDHHGQTEPIEALERHARRVGFSDASSLVRAWRAGYVTLLLDGFDEIASAGWAGKTSKLRELRYRSMELIRRFINETPTGGGMLLTGRAHFFDTESELRQALGIKVGTKVLKLSEFSASQVEEYLGTRQVPEWLPTRPLLLAYLVSRGILDEANEAYLKLGPADGWNELLTRVSEREAEIEAGIDPTTVRRLIEQVATVARSTVHGLGPVSQDALTDAFREICGYSPDDKGAVLLGRLPGLGASQMEDGSRVFIDRDFAEAARGGAIFSFIASPYRGTMRAENWQTTLRTLGIEVAARRCSESGFSDGKIEAAIASAYSAGLNTLCADMVLILNSMGKSYRGAAQLFIRDVLVEELRVDDSEVDLARIEFQDSVFGSLDLAYDFPVEKLPVFKGCHFARVEGRIGKSDVPEKRFPDCTFDEFEQAARTTRSMLSLSLPLGTRVLLTVLKKLYAQSGSGRKESALFRGLDAREQRLVGPVLELLRREGFAAKSAQTDDVVWLPTKLPDSRTRALSILAAPSTTTDSLAIASRYLD